MGSGQKTCPRHGPMGPFWLASPSSLRVTEFQVLSRNPDYFTRKLRTSTPPYSLSGCILPDRSLGHFRAIGFGIMSLGLWVVDFFLCWVWFRDVLPELVKSLEGRGDLVSKFRTPYCSREALCDCDVLARTSTSRTKHFYCRGPGTIFKSATISFPQRNPLPGKTRQ